MNYCTRLAAVLILLVTTLGGLAQYRPAWAAQVDLDWWSLPGLCDDLQRGERQSESQEAQRRAVVGRLGLRLAVIDDLRAGRLTLTQAAARFRRLNAAPGGCPIDLSRHITGATEEERLCRQVISWAEGADGPAAPGARAQTRRRLEAELARLLAEDNGVLRLQE